VVTVFDGGGRWAEGVLEGGHKRGARVRLRGETGVQEGARVGLTLATAVPKGDRGEWLVEQASQLNVAKVQWIDCDRGVVKPREGGGKIEKWRRLAVESAKQCHRARVMEVSDLRKLGEVVSEAVREGARVLWLEPRAGVAVMEAVGDATKVVALIGPEGGWSEREMELLRAGVGRGEVVRVKLTETILRIETACAAVGAIVGTRG